MPERKITDIDEYHWLRQELNDQQKGWLKKIIDLADSIGWNRGQEDANDDGWL